MAEILRDILKKHKIQQSVVAKALGLQRVNINRYDNMIERSVKEVILISKATGIPFSELIGIDSKDIKNVDRFLKKLGKAEKSINEVQNEN